MPDVAHGLVTKTSARSTDLCSGAAVSCPEIMNTSQDFCSASSLTAAYRLLLLRAEAPSTTAVLYQLGAPSSKSTDCLVV